jgi:hypothetical protein
LTLLPPPQPPIILRRRRFLILSFLLHLLLPAIPLPRRRPLRRQLNFLPWIPRSELEINRMRFGVFVPQRNVANMEEPLKGWVLSSGVLRVIVISTVWTAVRLMRLILPQLSASLATTG